MSDYFFFKERNYGKVNNDNYYLHTHNEYEIYMFIEGNSNFVSESCTKPDAPVIISTITEILYLINEISNFKPSAIVPTLIKKIMNYISLNIENDISLDDLADEFFVSKYHLCFKFKKFTGLTIGEYITQKRLALADNYIKNGETLSSAASKAGFSSYSAFYKAYKKTHNSSPRTSKKI